MLCGLAFLGITLCTMFPLAPRPIKLVALYVSMTLIIIIFSVLLIRGLVAMTTWIPTGRSLWIFPNLLSEVRTSQLQPATIVCQTCCRFPGRSSVSGSC